MASVAILLVLLVSGTLLLEQALKRQPTAAHATSGHVVINEVEYNPPGTDAGNEWIEFYNPTDGEVALDGWTLSKTAGKSVTIPSGVVPTGGYLVITLGVEWLGDDDEQITLRDSGGEVIDSTPIQSDAADDDRSWARHPDGASTWLFGSPTTGAPNGEQPVPEGLACLATVLAIALWSGRKHLPDQPQGPRTGTHAHRTRCL